MKVLFDHQIFSSQKYGGVSRYFCSLIEKISESSDIDWELPLSFSNNYYIREIPECSNILEFFPNINFRGKNRILEWLNRRNLLSWLRKHKHEISVFHPTFYEPYFLDDIDDIPFVLTVHDLTHDKFPELPAGKKEVRDKQLLVKRAATIITPTQSTKDDLVDIYGVNESKVNVIHHGPPDIKATGNTDIKLPEKYFLFIGMRRYYKNFDLLLHAFADCVKTQSDLKLLCVGGEIFSGTELDLIQSLGIRKNVLRFDFNDSELALAYEQALAFVFPSQCEGFGIPLLEAFGCGCPVIASDIPCFREVAEDGADYFNVDSKDELRDKLVNIINDSTYRNQLIYKGSKRLHFFSWEKCARETLEVYKGCLR